MLELRAKGIGQLFSQQRYAADPFPPRVPLSTPVNSWYMPQSSVSNVEFTFPKSKRAPRLCLHDDTCKMQQFVICCRGSISTCPNHWAHTISPRLQVSELFMEIISYPLAYILFRYLRYLLLPARQVQSV